MRRNTFANDEYYHIYNRGVEKRDIFCDERDLFRFLQSIDEFNDREAIGSLYENSFRKENKQLGGRTSKSERLVEIVAYCLNPNHFHLIVKQVSDKGVEKFMQRLGTGYTMYFNRRYQRSGGLFQGKFKSIHIDTNEYFLRLSVYVNLNNKVHRLGGRSFKSSWSEYMSGRFGIVHPEVILSQFKDSKEYEEFSQKVLEDILTRRILTEEF